MSEGTGTGVPITPPTSTGTYGQLSDPAKKIISSVKGRLDTLFDSYDGGPHIQDETASFTDDHYASLLESAVYLINGKGSVKKNYNVLSYPFGSGVGDGAAMTALLITTIKDFIIAYTEVAVAQGMTGPYLNRDDYQDRWIKVLNLLDKDLDEQIIAMDMQLLSAGGTSLLIWTNQQPFGIQTRVRPLRPPWYR